MNETEKRGSERPRASVRDFNASWPLMVVYLGYLVGMYFAQRSTFGLLNGSNQYAYFLIPLIFGIIVTFLFYNAGKILFAKIAGYKFRYMRVLGCYFDFSGEKMRFRYDILSFFDVAMRFSPKDDDLDKKPTLIFLGGLVGEFALLILSFALFAGLVYGVKEEAVIPGWGILFGAAYGFVLVIYEFLPLRQDYATDCFNLIMTKTAEQKKAFNLIAANKRREMQGLDYIVPDHVEPNSYYEAQVLYYVYLDNLYNSRLEQAVKNLEDMRYYAIDFPEDERYMSAGEYIYLRYLINDEQGADKLYLSLKNDDKVAVRKPEYLADYRYALFIAAYIQKSKEKIDEIVKAHDELIKTYPNTSRRLSKEIALFEEVYRTVQRKLPQLGLADRK